MSVRMTASRPAHTSSSAVGLAIELAHFDPRLRSESLQAAGDEQTGSVVAAQLVADADHENPGWALVSHGRR